MVEARRVGIVLRIRSVGDDEDLHIFIQPARRPKTVALIAVDLIERLADGNAAPLQFDMYERQAVD